MIDLDQYREASFRGVPFHVARAGVRFGHRVDVKEYPFQDRGLVTDMGLSDDRFELTIFVIGDDFVSQRKALEKAFRETGLGQLVHPTRGNIQVQVETVRHDEDYKELGVADFTVTFVMASDRVMPVAQIDTQAAVITSSVALAADAPDAFRFQAIDNPEVMAAAESDLATFTDALKGLSDTIAGATPTNALSGIAVVQALRADLKSVTGAATATRALANTIFSVTNQWHDLVDNPSSSLDMVMGMLSLGGISRIVDGGFFNPASLIARMSSTSFSTSPVSAGPDNAVNRTTSADLFDLGAVITGAKLSTISVFDTLPQALAARDSLTGQMDAIAVRECQGASPLAVSTFRSNVRTLRTAVYRDLTERSMLLPAMGSYTPVAVQPARVLSYRLAKGYDSRVAIASRNAIVHPSFTPSAVPLFFQKQQGASHG